MIADAIYRYLSAQERRLDYELLHEVGQQAAAIFERQFMREDTEATPGTLRLSVVGRCARQLAYAYHGFEKQGKTTDARAKLTFWAGDLAELTILMLAKLAGCQLRFTFQEQQTVEWNVNGHIVRGHPDALLETSDGDTLVVEVKSMSSFGYKRFEAGQIDESYLAQLTAYCDALKRPRGLFVAYNKDANVLAERIIHVDPILVRRLRMQSLAVLTSTRDELPGRPYAPDERGMLPFQCLYCAYWGHCWPHAQRIVMRGRYQLNASTKGVSYETAEA